MGLRPGRVLLFYEGPLPFIPFLGLVMDGLWEMKSRGKCWVLFCFFLYDWRNGFGNVGSQFSMSS